MFKAETKIRVRYAETDQMGYVYYGNYAQYYEVARVEALRQIGLSYRMLEELGTMMPVIRLECRYKKPARYDDELTLVTRINKLPGVRIHFHYDVLDSSGVLLNEGETELVFVDMKTQKPVQCPDLLLKQLQPFFKSAS